MKKVSLLIMASVLCFFVRGQDLQEGEDAVANPEEVFKSKNGHVVAPQAGDFGIGFNGGSLLNVLKFNDNSAQASTNFVYNNQLHGRYFLDSKTAVIAKLRWQYDRDTRLNRVTQDNIVPDPNVQVTDKQVSSLTNIAITVGLEKRRGHKRLYGIYGAEVGFFLNTRVVDYEYGNPITEGNRSPTTTNFVGRNSSNQSSRPTNAVTDNEWGLLLNGFAGIEYFVAPKISLGGTFSYGFSWKRRLRTRDTREEWDPANGAVREIETVRESNNSAGDFSLNAGNYSGTIQATFYF